MGSINLPKSIFHVAERLEKNGFEAYLVGGSVRDILFGKEPKDYDITTSATPEEVMNIFPTSVPTGIKFGTVTVLLDPNDGLDEVQITTFRSEKEYIASRWPSHVEFTRSLEEDLKRRDFTINAFAIRLMDISKYDSLTHELFFDYVIDLFDGKNDLTNKIIRAVGNPDERFQEDALRMLRACRLASCLSFQIEQNTFESILRNVGLVKNLSIERVRDELIKLVEESPKPSYGIELLRQTGILQIFIPELLEGYEMKHNRYHVDNIYDHYLRTLDIAPVEIRFAALFHDIGKPRTKDGEHFYGHDKVGAEMTKSILTRLKFPKSQIEKITNLVRWHMFYIPTCDITTSDEKIMRNESFKYGWSDAAIRRFINKIGGYQNFDDLIKLRISDALANPHRSFNPDDVIRLSKRVAELKEQDALFKITDLKVNGNDLKLLGLQGKKIGEMLRYLYDIVVEDPSKNQKEILLDIVKQKVGK